jgi:hypothetical protein
MTHYRVQGFLKHALRILIQLPCRFRQYVFQFSLRFFANAFYHIADLRIQILLKLLGRHFERFLLAGFLTAAIIL